MFNYVVEKMKGGGEGGVGRGVGGVCIFFLNLWKKIDINLLVI